MLAERDTLKTTLSETQAKAAGFDGVQTELARVKGELTAFQQRTERTGALAKHKVTDAMLPHFELVYNAATAGVEKPPTFAEWLDAAENGAKAHPLLTPHFAAQPPGANPNPPPKPANTLPDPAAGAGRAPPVPGARITEADTAAWMRSPAYLALAPADRLKALDAREAEVAAQAAQLPA